MFLTLCSTRFQWAGGLYIRAVLLVAITYNQDLKASSLHVASLFVFKRNAVVDTKLSKLSFQSSSMLSK